MLRIYNTLKGEVEEFRPMHGNRVYMFVCGPTVYDHCHLGHARTYLSFDTIARYIRFKGYSLFYIMNITDIDDKIISRAEERGMEAKDLADRYTELFFEDMEALNITSVNLYPKATEHVDEILRQIDVLVKKGLAYPMNESIYFEVNRCEDFGKLSKQSLDNLQAGARAEVREEKLNPEDFALWKAYKPGEPSWDSPWGKGRPGWHIEDTAITITYFGEQYDLHGGGRDLIFPHHDSEIAIAENVTGKVPFVNCWMHAGFLNIHGEKMSKSLGNFWTIREALEHYSPEVIRFFFLHTHYRSPIDIEDKAQLDEAQASYQRLLNGYNAIRNALGNTGEGEAALGEVIGQHRQRFVEAMDNDFNTREAIAALFDFTREMNRALESGISREDAKAAMKFMRDAGQVLGIFTEGKGTDEELLGRLMGMLLEERDAARQNKDYARADEIRDKLKEMGVVVEDKGGKSVWKLG